jgi:S-DNA-T family DNA segregation ATPase FtsK/SpoIIIE
VLFLFIGLSVLSYDWKDISVLKVPSTARNMIGPVGAWNTFVLMLLFGVGAYLVPLWSLVCGLILAFSSKKRVWPKLVWATVCLLSLILAIELSSDFWVTTCHKLNIADAGGLLGRAVAGGFLVRWLSPVGAGILIWSVFIVSLTLLVGVGSMVVAYGHTVEWLGVMMEKIRTLVEERQDRRSAIEKEEREIEKQRKRLEKNLRKEERKARLTAPESQKAPVPEPAPRKAVQPKKERVREPKETPVKAPPGSYELPPISLLESVEQSQRKKGIETDSGTTSRILVETLAEFGIEAEVTNVERGPVVTRYELLPAPGVRVERISGLSNNLALSLKAANVRVQAPVPGKGVVGIEVPNSVANMVYLRELIEGETWQTTDKKLPLVLGKDVGGNDIVADLTEMPHLLIAGATGAGKTVCMNSVLAGLLMSRTPAQMRLMLVDPKIVEFAVFQDLPHLVVPVITDPKKVAIGLRWAISEMENRYKLFARTGVRNIEGYNNRMKATQEDTSESIQADGAEKKETPDTIPYIVIIIDELADLMLSAQADIENCVARLAQLSRAVGIHMILSTQRPSVNVITGTIKANFPARIAFQVAQKVDSRTILDSVGAEKLLGRGDMLFQPPGTSKILRAQGAMTSDADIRSIVDFIKRQAEADYELDIVTKIEKTGTTGGGEFEDEDVLGQAIEIIRETQRASTSSLQRRLRIGYTRAARIMDILEERGIVGLPRGSDPREILIDLDAGIPDNNSE